jgi:ferric enterobactin receptor
LTAPARSVALAMLTVLAACSSAAAQGTPAKRGTTTTSGGEIRGRVVDAAGQTAIHGAIVDVSDSGATAPAAITTTDANGAFRVRGLRPATYRVRIRAIGYAARRLPVIAIGALSPGVDVGTVTLTRAPIALQEISVAERRQLDVDLAPDRNTYTVRDMPNTRGGTALDVLRNVPAVDVDIDNIVSLRGNTGVIVQINGRPSPMKPAQLGTFLAQLRAEMVDKVEVVPNPSARENPEGDAGIINIVLKQSADAGTSGGLTLGGGPPATRTSGATSVTRASPGRCSATTAFCGTTSLAMNRCSAKTPISPR